MSVSMGDRSLLSRACPARAGLILYLIAQAWPTSLSLIRVAGPFSGKFVRKLTFKPKSCLYMDINFRFLYRPDHNDAP
ncbi:protein of unknown function [Rhodovastum atsumiense]|nr:protein of unknown function [Rhodovastum atsumiense]